MQPAKAVLDSGSHRERVPWLHLIAKGAGHGPYFRLALAVTWTCCCLLVPASLRSQNLPSPAQSARITNAYDAAQAVVNQMPPGADRSALQNALNNFRRMNSAGPGQPGRVFVSPLPEGPTTPGPTQACTMPEYVIPGAGGDGGEAGATPEVGAGGESIILGSASPGSSSPSMIGPPGTYEYRPDHGSGRRWGDPNS